VNDPANVDLADIDVENTPVPVEWAGPVDTGDDPDPDDVTDLDEDADA
jgi:hypothetical protein